MGLYFKSWAENEYDLGPTRAMSTPIQGRHGQWARPISENLSKYDTTKCWQMPLQNLHKTHAIHQVGPSWIGPDQKNQVDPHMQQLDLTPPIRAGELFSCLPFNGSSSQLSSSSSKRRLKNMGPRLSKQEDYGQLHLH